MQFTSPTNSSLGSVVNAAKGALAKAGEFLTNGAHAQQTLPSQHRLRAAGGMFLGWIAMDKLRDYMFGVQQKSEGEYVEIPLEEVPPPLKFLYKTIDWNPHSDDPKEQYKKILYQCMPMVGAGLGTLAGSMSAFGPKGPLSGQLGANGREGDFNKFTKSKTLSLLEGDMSAQYAQAKTFRVMTALFGGFSAASMVNIIYGVMLNSAFVLANGARVFGFGGGLEMGNMGPTKAADALVNGVSHYVKAFERGDKEAITKFASTFEKRVLEPLFSIKDPKKQEEVRNLIKNLVEKSYESHKNLKAGELEAAVAADMKKTLGTLDRATVEKLGLHLEDATLGEAFWPGARIKEFLEKIGLVSKEKTTESYLKRVLAHPQNAPQSGYAMGGAS